MLQYYGTGARALLRKVVRKWYEAKIFAKVVRRIFASRYSRPAGFHFLNFFVFRMNPSCVWCTLVYRKIQMASCGKALYSYICFEDHPTGSAAL